MGMNRQMRRNAEKQTSKTLLAQRIKQLEGAVVYLAERQNATIDILREVVLQLRPVKDEHGLLKPVPPKEDKKEPDQVELFTEQE